MQVDRHAQMQKLVFEITNLLETLVSKIGSLLIAILQELWDQNQANKKLEETVERLTRIETENDVLRERYAELASECVWKDGEICSRADYWDIDE